MTRGSLIVLSSVHWNFTWQRHQDLSSRLAARGWAVTFVEPLPKRWPRLTEAGRVLARLRAASGASGECEQRRVPAVEIVSPTLLPDVGPVCRMLNRSVFVPPIARRLDRGTAPRPLVVINYLPISASVELQKLLAPDLIVYDCVWDWPNDPHSAAETIREQELVAAADVVFADSPFLYERMQTLHSHVVRILPAVDVDLWLGQTPPRAERQESVRCGYFGQVGANIDLDLLRRISWRFKLRLIGPVEASLGGFGPDLEVVGGVPREALPGLLADLDVLVLPYRRPGHTRGVIPAKTFECLATGKPTVAIGLPSLTEFGDLFYLCHTEDDFLSAIERAPLESPEVRDRRLAAAGENSWEKRIDEVEGAIFAALTRKLESEQEP